MTFINICMSLPLQVVNDFSVEAPGSSNEEMLPVHELWPESKADPVRKRVTSSRSQGFQLDSNYWDTKLFNMTWKENKASQSWRGTRNLRVRKGFRNHGVQNPPCTDEGSVAESPREHPGHGTHFCLRFPGVAVSMSFRTHVGLVYQLPLPSRRLTVFSSSLRLKGDIPQHPIPFSSPPPRHSVPNKSNYQHSWCPEHTFNLCLYMHFACTSSDAMVFLPWEAYQTLAQTFKARLYLCLALWWSRSDLSCVTHICCSTPLMALISNY